ncbi:hypothetical protein [Lysobacter gummosus]
MTVCCARLAVTRALAGGASFSWEGFGPDAFVTGRGEVSLWRSGRHRA